MILSSLIKPKQIILEMQATEQLAAIKELVNKLIELSLLEEEQREQIEHSLVQRENQVSTGIGSGVAIPHAFSDDVDEVTAIFGRSNDGIDFDSLDNAPVKFILLFIVPKKDYHMHLQTLAAIAKLFNNCEVRKQLEEATTPEEILLIFGSKPSRIHSEKVITK